MQSDFATIAKVSIIVKANTKIRRWPKHVGDREPMVALCHKVEIPAPRYFHTVTFPRHEADSCYRTNHPVSCSLSRAKCCVPHHGRAKIVLNRG